MEKKRKTVTLQTDYKTQQNTTRATQIKHSFLGGTAKHKLGGVKFKDKCMGQWLHQLEHLRRHM